MAIMLLSCTVCFKWPIEANNPFYYSQPLNKSQGSSTAYLARDLSPYFVEIVSKDLPTPPLCVTCREILPLQTKLSPPLCFQIEMSRAERSIYMPLSHFKQERILDSMSFTSFSIDHCLVKTTK